MSFRPLARDLLANRRMVYDASYWANCRRQDPNDPGGTDRDEYVELWNSVRAVFVPQP